MLLTKYIEDQKKSNMPEELKNTLLQSTSIWTNGACYGYIIMAMEDAGCSKELIGKVLRHARDVMDFVTPEEAEQKHERSNY